MQGQTGPLCDTCRENAFFRIPRIRTIVGLCAVREDADISIAPFKPSACARKNRARTWKKLPTHFSTGSYDSLLHGDWIVRKT